MCNEIGGYFSSRERPYVVGACQGASFAAQKAYYAIGSFLNGVNWLDKQVRVLGEPYIPPSAMGTTRAFARMMPYLGIAYALPAICAWTLYGGIVAYAFLTNSTLDTNSLSDAENAMSVATIISGTQDIRNGVREWRVFKIGWGLLKVTGAGYVLYRKLG